MSVSGPVSHLCPFKEHTRGMLCAACNTDRPALKAQDRAVRPFPESLPTHVGEPPRGSQHSWLHVLALDLAVGRRGHTPTPVSASLDGGGEPHMWPSRVAGDSERGNPSPAARIAVTPCPRSLRVAPVPERDPLWLFL